MGGVTVKLKALLSSGLTDYPISDSKVFFIKWSGPCGLSVPTPVGITYLKQLQHLLQAFQNIDCLRLD